MSTDCMNYYYPTEELRQKYNLKCSLRFFENYSDYGIFNNENFLNFILKTYGPEAFSGESPFVFDSKYKDLTNEEICDVKEYSLKPQQKL